MYMIKLSIKLIKNRKGTYILFRWVLEFDHFFVFNIKYNNSILYTKVEKFMIIARAPRLEPEARRGL
jgi:hypothetical protein